MTIYALMTALTTVTTLGLGFFVWQKNFKSPIHASFFYITLTSSIWSFGRFMSWNRATNLDQAIFWEKFLNIGVILGPVVVLHFLLIWVERMKEKKYILIAFYIISNILLALSIFTDQITSVVTHPYFHYYPTAVYPLGYISFFITHVIILGYVFYLGIKENLRAKGTKRMQLLYFLISLMIGFGSGATLFFYMLNLNIPPFGIFIVWLYPILISFAIIRYRFLEVSIIVRKSIIFSLLVILVTAFYGAAIYFSRNYFPLGMTINRWVWAFFASLVIALTLDPLYKILARLTDKIFFKRQYNYEQALRKTSQEIASIIRLEELALRLNEALKTTIKVDKVSLFAFDSFQDEYLEHSPTNSKNKKIYRITKDSALIFRLLNSRQYIITEALDRRLIQNVGSVENLSKLSQIKEELNKGDWALSVPLIKKDRLIGILNLGPKLSEDPFSSTDLRLLTTLASQIAVAVENASIYEKERRLSEAKSEFISVASHRLRTPLSVIKWALSLLDEDKAELSPRQRDLVNRALQSNTNMIKLANDLLNVSRIEEKKVFKNPKPTQLLSIIEEILTELSEQASEKELGLSFDKPKEELPLIFADRDRLKLALINVIQNSIFYTLKGGHIFIDLKLEKDLRHILLTVKDTGIGIARLEHSKVFDKFFRTQSAINIYTEGSGLGLFMTKSIIEEHQGEIWFDSKADGGTTFYIKLKINKEK